MFVHNFLIFLSEIKIYIIIYGELLMYTKRSIAIVLGKL